MKIKQENFAGLFGGRLWADAELLAALGDITGSPSSQSNGAFSGVVRPNCSCGPRRAR
jgi:hypothetical protein